MSRKRFVDALESLSSSSSSSSSSEAEAERKVEKKPKRKLTIQDLEKYGYTDRPSILFIPEPRNQENTIPVSSQYSLLLISMPTCVLRRHEAKDRSGELAQEESMEEREATTRAVNEGVEEIADFVMKRVEHAEELLQERKKEQRKMARSKRLTFNQKVLILSNNLLDSSCLVMECGCHSRKKPKEILAALETERTLLKRRKESVETLECTKDLILDNCFFSTKR